MKIYIETLKSGHERQHSQYSNLQLLCYLLNAIHTTYTLCLSSHWKMPSMSQHASLYIFILQSIANLLPSCISKQPTLQAFATSVNIAVSFSRLPIPRCLRQQHRTVGKIMSFEVFSITSLTELF